MIIVLEEIFYFNFWLFSPEQIQVIIFCQEYYTSYDIGSFSIQNIGSLISQCALLFIGEAKLDFLV